jgi:hypothetical protein
MLQSKELAPVSQTQPTAKFFQIQTKRPTANIAQGFAPHRDQLNNRSACLTPMNTLEY